MNSVNDAASQGWIKAVDPKSGRTYYANTVTRKTQWQAPEGWCEEECPPLAPPGDSTAEDDELPSNWEVMHDPTTGKPFYVDHDRKITQWTRPRREKKDDTSISHAPANTTTSAAMTRILQASSSNYGQPRSYLQEASYFQPAQVGPAGEVDLSDSMPDLDFAVKKVSDRYRLECPHCDALFTLSKRRHHCRLCGDIFCDACSGHRVSLPLEGTEYDRPVRICDFCNRDVEQGNFFSMRRYLTPLTLFDPENGDEDDENGVATSGNVNAALAALTSDLDQIVQNAEGFEEKVTIPPHILVPNIIKHINSRAGTSERAIRALASLLSLGSMVGKSVFAHSVYAHGKKQTLDQVLGILERSGSDRRTLFVQEKAAQAVFYLTEPWVMASVGTSQMELDDQQDADVAEDLDIQRCLRNMLDHSSTSKNPNLQRWSTASVRNLVIEDQRLSCLSINEAAARVASGEPALSPAYESFLDDLVSTGGIMILCSLIGADDSDTRAHATGALGAVLAATRAIDDAMSALAEMTGGTAGRAQRKDGAIIRSITVGSGFGSSVSQLLLSADNTVASMGCNFVASLVSPVLSDPEGSASLPSKYDCRTDPQGLGACREAALEVANGCLPALLSLVRENGHLTRPIELRCAAMETLAATATAVGEMGKAWAGGKYEEGMEINDAPPSLTQAVTAINEEQGVDIALEVLESAEVQSLGSQRDTPAARIREAAGIVLAAISSCSAQAIIELHSRCVLSKLVLAANDSTMTAPSNLRGDNAPRCLGMSEAASAVLMFAWQHPAGAYSELLDRLIEVIDVGAITYLFRALTFKMDWESRENSAGAMKARSAACRLVCCLFGIALTDETSIGMRRLIDSCDADQSSRRVSKGPRNIMEAVLTALQTSLSHAHQSLSGTVDLGAHYHSALLGLVESALLAAGSMCGSSVAPGGSDGNMVSGDQFLAYRADEFESRRKEVCKVACDIVIRGGRSGPAILPTMLIGGFGEGSVGASLRLALAIAQNGSKEQHSKLALSGILVPVSDILKTALSAGDLYKFSAALALVRFCGPHVASGTNGGIQSVRDAIKIATNVLTLPLDYGASAEQIQVQESLKAECVYAIESLSKNASLWSAISNDALPPIISYLNNSMDHLSAGKVTLEPRSAAMRAVLEVVQVPSHAVYAAEHGLAGSVGKLVGMSCRENANGQHIKYDIEVLAMKILHTLAAKRESRRHCKLTDRVILGNVCAAIGADAAERASNADNNNNLAVLGVEILHFVVADIQTLGDTADMLNSKETEVFVDALAGETSFVRALCSCLLRDKTGIVLNRGETVSDSSSVYGPCWKISPGPCAGFERFEDAAASMLFTLAVYSCAVDSSNSDSFWSVFLLEDLYSIEGKTECLEASLSLVALFLALLSDGYSAFKRPEEHERNEHESLLYPLLRHRLLEAARDLLRNEITSTLSRHIDTMMKILVAFRVPRICLSLWQDPALLDLGYEILTILVDEKPKDTLQSFVDSRDSILSLFDMLNTETPQEAAVSSTETRRFLASLLEELAESGALADAVERYDIRSSAINALAVACLAEEERSQDDEEEELTSNRLASRMMQCLVDLCCVRHDGKDQKTLDLEPEEASSIADKLGKKICQMVISRFLERAKMHQYQLDDCNNIMEAPDVAMLCAVAQHEAALLKLRSIGGFHALAQVAGEGEISAMEALSKGCKDDPSLLLEADTYLSVLSLFSNRPPQSDRYPEDVESTAFNLIAQLCTGSLEGRKAVIDAPSFNACFERAVDLATTAPAFQDTANNLTNDPSPGTSDALQNENLLDNQVVSKTDQVVEAAYLFLSSTVSSSRTRKDLVCNPSFVEACSSAAERGKPTVIRNAALDIVVRLSRCASADSALTPEVALDLLLKAFAESSSFQGISEVDGMYTLIIAAEGLIFLLQRLSPMKQEVIIQETGKLYSSVLKSRSLSRLKSTTDRALAAKLAYCLTKIMLAGLGNNHVEDAYAASIITLLLGTVQWRFDVKTTLDSDEEVYWEACATHALLILASWFEEGKNLMSSIATTDKMIDLSGNVWMVARPSKAPRKAVDFPTALGWASKSKQSADRLAADRIMKWLREES